MSELNPGTEINLDLSIATLARACKGNVKLLPSFMVHSDSAWPSYRRAQLDSRNRIHMRRSTFLQVVCSAMPVRPGIWHGIDVQEFYLDLQPHHLDGSADMADRAGYKHSRLITRTDEFGRNPWDFDYGKGLSGPSAARPDSSLASVELATDGPRRAVRSTVFDGADSE
jgi:hypothetical protein